MAAPAYRAYGKAFFELDQVDGCCVLLNCVVIMNVICFAFADAVSLETPVRLVLFGKWRTSQRRDPLLSFCQVLSCMRFAF